MRNFPQELVDKVIDYYSGSDETQPSDIGICSLVCKAWVDRSQCNLFRTVLTTFSAIAWLNKSIESNQNIAGYILHLTIRVTTFETGALDNEPGSRLVTTLLGALNSLETLDLEVVHPPVEEILSNKQYKPSHVLPALLGSWVRELSGTYYYCYVFGTA
ncbi:hypothetical protein B0H15DRAFT_792155 [Mycena belliarum]|uniref:Uncharacterized protein n=1 Tax=Mycena belliarum TaxID=1033014 RepID=A0AAD6XF08_9AGAR|nr:hypothetical protein B0H15DRAFT_792155 [Mycena belliae]